MNDHYIQRVVKNKSFLDVGPLWLTIFEKITVAHLAGARELTAIDQWDESDLLWEAFRTRLQKFGVPKCDCVVGDVDYFEGNFDVTYCAGVLYHNPEPIGLLKKLYSLTNEYCIVSTTFTESYIKNSKGELSIPSGSSLLLAGMDEYDLGVVQEDWRQFLGGNNATGLIPRPDEWPIWNKHLWWWLFTKEAIYRMCEIAGFKVEDVTFYPKIMTLLLKKPSAKVNKIFG